MASMVGDIMRHGPHHSAQKSTKTGTSELRTSLSQAASVKVKVFAPAMFSILYCYQMLKPPKGFSLLEAAGITGCIRTPKLPTRSLFAYLRACASSSAPYRYKHPRPIQSLPAKRCRNTAEI